MTEWYYADRQGQQRGPVQTQELLSLRNSGQIGMETLIWRNGMNGWQAFATMANEIVPSQAAVPTPMQGSSMYELASPVAAPTPEIPAAPAPAAVPAAAGSYSMYDVATPIQHADAQANDPYAAPRAQVGPGTLAVQGGHIVYAGFWKRVAASLIDVFAIGIPVGIVIGILGVIFGIDTGLSARTRGLGNPGINLLSYLLQAVVFAWFYSNASLRATPGKLAIGIKVVRGDGEPISFLRGFGRYWAYLLSAIMLGIGYLMAAFTDRKQALHDMICDTVVVDKWAFSEHPEWQDDTLGTVTKVVLGLGIVLFVGFFFVMCSVIAGLAGR